MGFETQRLLTSGVLLLLAGTAQAAEDAAPNSGLYLHVGPGALLFSPSAKVRAEGTTIPGATVNVHSNVTATFELGYRYDTLGVSLTVGAPPSATVRGADTLAPLGALGRIRYGPTVLSAHYHFTQFGRFRPYVGAGPVFLLVFSNQDLAVQNLKVRANTGAAVQAGADYDLDRRWSLFLDVKKAYLRTSATADLGPVPLTAKIRLDPAVVSGGVSYRF